jgi:hypothetical protein
MKRKIHSRSRAVKSVDDSPLFAWAAGQQAEKKRVEAAVPKNANEPIRFVITVKDHERIEMRKVIESGDGVLQPIGERITVTDDILPALIELLAGRGAHR